MKGKGQWYVCAVPTKGGEYMVLGVAERFHDFEDMAATGKYLSDLLNLQTK